MVTLAVSNSQLNEFGAPYKASRKDFIDVTGDFAAEKPYTVLKAGHVVPEFLMKMGYLPGDNPSLNNACFAARMGKLSRSPFEFYTNTVNTLDTLALWLKGSTTTFKGKCGQSDHRQVKVTDVARAANKCINPIWEMADFLTRAILYIPKNSVRTLEVVNGIALAISMSWNAIDSLNWIEGTKYSSLKGAIRDKRYSEMLGTLITLAKEVVFIALGVLVVLSVIFQFVFSPLLFSSLSTASVVLTILEYYYQNIGEKKKNKI